MNAQSKVTPKFGRVERVSDSDSTLETWGLDSDGDEGANIQIRCSHEDPKVERAMIEAAVHACNVHDALVDALREAEKLLDSVAFVANEGDTKRPLSLIRSALVGS